MAKCRCIRSCLYELALNLIGFVLLWRLRKSSRLPEGGLAGVYLIYYACVRSFTSLFRADDLYLGPLRLPHVVSLVMIVAGLYLLRPREHRRRCVVACLLSGSFPPAPVASSP